MDLQTIVKELDLRQFTGVPDEREVTGAYIGDLLSWVMGRAEPGDAWITIMSNQNVAAVAVMASVSCVILAEGVEPAPELLETAKRQEIVLLGSGDSAYKIAVGLHRLSGR